MERDVVVRINALGVVFGIGAIFALIVAINKTRRREIITKGYAFNKKRIIN